jgi:microcystin-dependent protein
MADPYLGEIRLFGTTYAPNGWAFCEGQILPIAQNQALFALLGTTYGGNGTSTFALPDLRGRVPIHFNGIFPLGNAQGEQSHTLTVTELPQHNHQVSGSSNNDDSTSPQSNTWGTQSQKTPFLPPANLVQMNTAALTNAGGNQAHANMQPYQALNYCIALVGIFPSRN